jgi:hypothetical protein
MKDNGKSEMQGFFPFDFAQGQNDDYFGRYDRLLCAKGRTLTICGEDTN